MGLIKYFFVINSRGSPVAIRGFLTEPTQSIIETFYQRMIDDPPPPPVFRLDGFNFAYIMYSQLYFCLVTEESMAPSVLLELLGRITSVISDYCGRCTELVMQKNLGLIYEIVDEVLSFGCPQATDSSNLLHLVHNTVNFDKDLLQSIINIFSSADYDRPLALKIDERSNHANEIFLILNEKLELLLDLNNQPLRSNITGVMTVKSYLQGQPSVMVQLDPQMFVTTRAMQQNLSLKYDDVVFAPFVQTQSFDSDRSITFSPPEGLTTILSYRTTRPFQPPFTITPNFENIQKKVIVVRVSLQSNFPAENIADDVKIKFQCPIGISSASCELPPSVASTQSGEYDNKTRQVIWRIKKFSGLAEFSSRFRFIFDNGIECGTEEVHTLLGPISMEFNLLGHLPSGISLKNYIVSTSGSSTPPKRWVKEIATGECYTFNFI